MHLRWKLCVVVGGATGAGREVCRRLARAGAGVLVADPDLAAAEAVAAEIRVSRVSSWSLRVDPADEADLDLLVARVRDLGGADVVVVAGLEAARAGDMAARLLPAPDVVALAGDDPVEVAVAALEHLHAAEAGTALVIA
jgi:NAD(P)-dependent dehydrogenase (short-subunit alcohol dehydrogenase family)